MLWNKLNYRKAFRLALSLCMLWLQAGLIFAASPPPNDLCTGAEVIPGSGPFPYRSLIIPDISGATTAGDPVLNPSDTNCYQIVSRGIWYKFTPTVAGFYEFSVNDTATTVDDTFMALYTSAGGCSGPFIMRACNDDAGFDQSALATNLTAFTTYYLVVWNVTTNAPDPGATAVQLKVSKPQVPASDICSGAEIIPSAGPFPYFTSTNDTLMATNTGDPPLPSCNVTNTSRSIWYRFTPSASGVYQFTTLSNTATRVFDTLLAVYTASSCAGPFTLVTCNDNLGSDLRSAVSATLTAGTIYYIVVWDVEEGSPGVNTVQLGVWRIGPPTVATLPATGIASTGVVLNATVTPNATNESTQVWFNWGTSVSYGNSTDVTLLSSNLVKAPVSFVPLLSPLANTFYHYRVAAGNSKGTNFGVDRTFIWSNTPPRLLSYKFQSNGTYRLQFTGNSNQVYQVQASTSLTNWTDLGVASPLTGTSFEFIDFDAPIYPRSFYRLQSP